MDLAWKQREPPRKSKDRDVTKGSRGRVSGRGGAAWKNRRDFKEDERDKWKSVGPVRANTPERVEKELKEKYKKKEKERPKDLGLDIIGGKGMPTLGRTGGYTGAGRGGYRGRG